MTRQSTLFWSPKSIAAAALVGLGLLVLFGNLDGPAAQFNCPLGTTVGEALGVLPSVVLAAASRALEACLFDHQWSWQGLFQMLVSFWLLLFVIAGAVLVRAAFKGKV